MSMVPLDSDKPEGSIRSDEISVPVDGTDEPEFEIPVSTSNQLEPERRAREFRARHIQMMALGKKS
jgi:amino acid permease